MPLERFIPKSPDPFIRNSQDFEVAKFGHLNTIIEYVNTYVVTDSLQLSGTGPLTSTARYITDSLGNASSLAISSGNIGIGTSTPGAVLEIYGGTETLGISGPANQAKSIQIARYNNSSFQAHYIGDDGDAFFGAGLTISASGSGSQIYLQVSASGRNVNIGTAGQTLLPKDMGARLGVRGSGSTSATTSLLVQNSLGTNLLKLADDGNVGIGTTTPQGKLDVRTTDGLGSAQLCSNNDSSLPLRLFRANNGLVSINTLSSGGTIDSPSDRATLGSLTRFTGNAYVNGAYRSLARMEYYLDAIPITGVAPCSIRFLTVGASSSTYSLDERMGITSDGNVQINESIVTNRNAKLFIKGSGSTAATTSLLVQNSGSADLLRVTDDGLVTGAAITSTGTLRAANNKLEMYNPSGNEVRLRNPSVGNYFYIGPSNICGSDAPFVCPSIFLNSGGIYGSNTGIVTNTQAYSMPTQLNPIGGANSCLINLSGGGRLQGSADGQYIRIEGTIQLDGVSNELKGFYFNPTLTGAFSPQNVFAIHSTYGGAYLNTATPQASAVLQADSTTQGFLPPRMTTTQRTGIVLPASGLIVYDTDTNKSYTYDGTAWQAHW